MDKPTYDEDKEYLAFNAWFKERGYPNYPQQYPLITENAMHSAWQEAAKRATVSAQKPVAYRCKDFADGWILYHDGREAELYQKRTGCLMQTLYTDPHDASDVSYPPEPEEVCRESLKSVVADLNGRLSKLVTESGMMGLHDTIRNATDRITNLTSSYLDACADNDRLRQLLSEAETREREARAKALEEAANVARAVSDENRTGWKDTLSAHTVAKAIEDRIKALQQEAGHVTSQ